MDLNELKELSKKHPIVFYDGVCGLCNSFVQFLIRRDDQKIIRFASLQSDLGQMVRADNSTTDEISTVILLKKGNMYYKSEVVFELLDYLYPSYKLLKIFRFIPKGIRNWIYDRIASIRYAVFGRKEKCEIPHPKIRDLFLSI